MNDEATTEATETVASAEAVGYAGIEQSATEETAEPTPAALSKEETVKPESRIATGPAAFVLAFNNAVPPVTLCASKDETRPNLQAVNIRRGGVNAEQWAQSCGPESVVMLTTDGRRLALCSIDAEPIGGNDKITIPEGGVSIPSHIIDAATKEGKKARGRVVALRVEGNKAILFGAKGSIYFDIPEDIQFPQVEHVIPSRIDFNCKVAGGSSLGVNHVVLNPWYLLETALACGDVEKGGPDTGANMHFFDVLSPVVVCSYRGLGVIMPMRDC